MLVFSDGPGNRMLFWAVTAVLCSVMGCGTQRVGVRDRRLAPCPDSPNCVSSYEAGGKHFVAPFQYQGPMNEAKQAILSVLRSMPRVAIVKSDDNYIHAECRSRVFRFVDDLEFFFDGQAHLIHVRSASRTGYSDFGVNRKRVEEIRSGFMRLTADSPGGNN